MINRETSINMNHVPNSNRMDKLIFFGGGERGGRKVISIYSITYDIC